jgi:hypothetical protein
MRRMRTVGWALALTLVAAPARAADPPAVVELFDDDAEELIAQLTNDGGADGSTATRDDDHFSGLCSLRVTPQQRFRSQIKGWSFPIRARPALGEYRYLRLAWKKVGGSGIMVQLCDNGNWEHRYVGGTNAVGWAALAVPGKAPDKWTVVTRDLAGDFGEFTLTGMAFTPMDGTAGLFDHIYLGRTTADLDKVTNAALGKTEVKAELKPADLDRLWQELASDDPAVSAPALWALTAGKKESVPYLRDHLKPGPAPDEKEILKLIADLDDERFKVREAAEEELGKRGEAATALLRKALRETNSAEVRTRVERLLEKRKSADEMGSPEHQRLRRVVRLLETVGSDEAKKALEALGKEAAHDRVRQEAKKALERLAARTGAKP